MDLQPVKPAGIRFRLAQDAAQVLLGPPWARPDTRTNTGPMRPRIVGNLEELGFCKEETSWEPQGGLDLWWEGDCWTSTVISTEPDLEIEFCVVRLDQAESHPGLMQAWERTEMHEATRTVGLSRCFRKSQLNVLTSLLRTRTHFGALNPEP